MPVIPATREAEAGEPFEPRRQKSLVAGSEQRPDHSGLQRPGEVVLDSILKAVGSFGGFSPRIH